MVEAEETSDWLVSIRTIADRLELSEAQVRRLVHQGVLPEPLRLGKKCVRWNWNDVVERLNTRS